MDAAIKIAQLKVLEVFAKEAKTFALAGGTALELYYLHHRFSRDLGFFSPVFDPAEIDRLISSLRKRMNTRIELESELERAGKAKVRFYTMPVKGASRPLKIDFVEDVLNQKPAIDKIKGVRVYSAKEIYLQKIAAISGTRSNVDNVGRSILTGRNEARDAFDLYMLSIQVEPLHIFLRKASSIGQMGLIHWYRTFSRQDLKLALLDMDIYDTQFDSRKLISHLESEIKKFSSELIEE